MFNLVVYLIIFFTIANWCDDIEKAFGDGYESAMSASSPTEGWKKMAEGSIKEVMKLLNKLDAEDTKGRGRRDMIDDAKKYVQDTGMGQEMSESKRKEILESGKRRKEKKYHTVDRLSTAAPLKNVKAMINALTSWLTRYETNKL